MKPQDSAKASYDAIAAVYDDFTYDHDFELWLGNLLPALQEHGLTGFRMLDVGCGTGKSFIPMILRGWEVTACDISPEMAAVAQAKAGKRARVAVADMRSLPVLGEFDLAWCLTEAINYLLKPEELRRAFQNLAHNLRRGGLLTFDLSTLGGFRTFYAKEILVERGGRRIQWKGRVDPDNFPPGSVAEASMSATPLRSGIEEVGLTLHRLRHFPPAEVLGALEDAGLKCLGTYGIHYDAVLQTPLDEERHMKAVYIAKRP